MFYLPLRGESLALIPDRKNGLTFCKWTHCHQKIEFTLGSRKSLATEKNYFFFKLEKNAGKKFVATSGLIME